MPFRDFVGKRRTLRSALPQLALIERASHLKVASSLFKVTYTCMGWVWEGRVCPSRTIINYSAKRIT